jgi:hypothetical protein
VDMARPCFQMPDSWIESRGAFEIQSRQERPR